MDPIILGDIPFGLDLEALREEMRLPREGEDSSRLCAMAREAEAIARPKAAYGQARVESCGGGRARIGGIAFAGALLERNLAPGQAVFPFVATCGSEIDAWLSAFTEPLERYWAEAMLERALDAAVAVLTSNVEPLLSGAWAVMNPGSLPDWPLEEQRPLFALLGEAPGSIGVELSPSCLMQPRKSLSGLMFRSDEAFCNCRLCQRRHCPKRRVAYAGGGGQD